MGEIFGFERLMEPAWRAEQMLGHETGDAYMELNATLLLLRLANERGNCAEARNELNRARMLLEKHRKLIDEFITDVAAEQTELERHCG